MTRFEELRQELPKEVLERIENKQATLDFMVEGITNKHPAALDIREKAKEAYPYDEKKMRDLEGAIIYVCSFGMVLEEPEDLLIVCDGAEKEWDVKFPENLRTHLINAFTQHCECSGCGCGEYNALDECK